jgi:5-methylcytosine-specific restriction endonuclease McrA
LSEKPTPPRLAARGGVWFEQGDLKIHLSQEAYSPDSFSTEHIVPEILGGDSAEDNLARACQGCNNFKYTKTTGIDPITLQEVPLFHPRRDVWEEHFAWSRDLTELIGLTPTGRATIVELR